MKNRSNGVKWLLGIWISGYVLGLLFAIIIGFNGKRVIDIEKQTQFGVILVKEQKLKVNSSTIQASLPVHATNAIDYLMLNNKETGNLLSIMLKIALWGFALYVLWMIDMSDPFDPRTLKVASYIGSLYILILIANAIGNYYTVWWFNNLYHPVAGDFRYPNSGPGFFTFIFPLVIVSTILTFYRIAVYNQQQQDLTI